METITIPKEIIKEIIKEQEQQINLANLYNKRKLKVGQKFKMGKKIFAYSEMRNTKASCKDCDNGNYYLVDIWKDIELIDEIDETVIKDLKESKDIENEVRDLRRGTHFIGTDNKEYIYIESKRTKFECANVNNIDIRYTAGFKFCKEILDKRTTIRS
jgi:hypothetical protein